MTRIHWERNNHFIHYGGAGLDMFNVLGYVAKNDARLLGHQPSLFQFDADAKQLSINQLTTQIASRIYSVSDGIVFADLFAKTCNLSPASADIYKEAIGILRDHRDVEVISATTGKSTQARVQDGDRIAVPSQRNFFIAR